MAPVTMVPSDPIVIEISKGVGLKAENVAVTRGVQKIITLNVTNTSNSPFEITNNQLNSSTEIVYNNAIEQFDLLPKQSRSLTMTALFDSLKACTYKVNLHTKNLINDKKADVSKELVFHVHSELSVSMLNVLMPKEPFKRARNLIVHVPNAIVDPGERVKQSVSAPKSFPLKSYPVPNYLPFLVNSGLDPSKATNKEQKRSVDSFRNLLSRDDNGNLLTPKNYTKVLSFLLHAEEYQTEINIRQYDTKSTLSTVNGMPNNYLRLMVPGLAENRPSVICGDSVYIKTTHDNMQHYEGIVNFLESDSVILGFSHRFANSVFQQNKQYFVLFSFNRMSMKVGHQALELAANHGIESCLFPKLPDGKVPEVKLNLEWFNKVINTNLEQQQAVMHVLAGTSRPVPYLIFGPPGTGKTTTIVECILQVWKTQPSATVLVCATTNAAADEVTRRLSQCKVPKEDLLRYVAISYPLGVIPQEITGYINYYKNCFFYPTKQQLTKYRIIVTTLITAARLVNVAMPDDHFSYVFIDESGHATEAHSLVPIAGILSAASHKRSLKGQLVLAGDPKQLGPVVQSNFAKEYGFEMSLLERLMNTNTLYQKQDGSYNNRVLTKLVKNYRSHPAILEIPKRQFYDGVLYAEGSKEIINRCLGSRLLPNAKFPIIFHSVIGIDVREKSDPSYFNVQELDVATNYLVNLIGHKVGDLAVTQKHIAVLTPYHRQVNKFKQIFGVKKWDQLLVGSVEQLQGQERDIVIISTVRSKPELMSFDRKFNLGFVSNAKRFNVALTRARALLIVIGNPLLLQYDPNWREFIKYCQDNGAIAGTPFTLAEKSLETIANGVANINLKGDKIGA